MDTPDLSDFFSTKPEADEFSSRLSIISQNLYEVNFNLEESLREQFGVRKKDKFIKLMREHNISLSSNQDLNNFFAKIKEVISALPVASMTLAVEPTGEMLKAITNWFIMNLKQQVLIETEIDPELIAGAVINYKGKFHDASVKSVFDQICEETLTKKDSEKNLN